MQEFPSKFLNPAFCHLISLIDLSFKIGTPLFFEEHLLIIGRSLETASSGKSVYIGEKTIAPILCKRNLHSFEHSPLIRGGSACLFFGQTGVKGATLLPERLIVHFCSIVQDFKCKSIIFVSPCTRSIPKSTPKDTFHNLIFVLTKDIFGVLFFYS
jgi:hypothetical protein